MPISFSIIPDHIKNSIAQKQNIQDFAKFHECSRACSKFVQKMRYKVATDSWNINKPLYNDDASSKNLQNLQFNCKKKWTPKLSMLYRRKRLFIPQDSANELPIQIMGHTVNIYIPLTEELCNWLIAFIKKTKSTVNCLYARRLKCTMESLNTLIEVSKIDKFMASGDSNFTIPWNYLTVPAIKTLKQLYTYYCSIEDFQLETLKMPYIELYETKMSCKGVNLLLKEWLNYKRKISKIRVVFKHRVEKATIFNGISFCEERANKAIREIYIVKNGRGDELRVIVGCFQFANSVCVDIQLNVNQ